MNVPGLDSIGPERKSADVTVSIDGLIAYTTAFDDQERAVTVIDSRGTVLGRFGGPGRGPGELNLPLQLGFAGREVFVLEVAGRRASRFSTDGQFLSMLPTPGAYYLMRAAGDSVDVLEWPTGPVPISDYRRISVRTLTGRVVIGGQAPVVRAMAKNATTPGAAIATILYFAVGPNVVVANPNAYEIQVVGASGSPLYALRRPTAAPPVAKFKEAGGLHVDARSRLWVVSDPPGTANSIADIYSGSEFVGTVDVGCRGNVSIAGDWMTVLCTMTNDPAKDVELRVFRIMN